MHSISTLLGGGGAAESTANATYSAEKLAFLRVSSNAASHALR